MENKYKIILSYIQDLSVGPGYNIIASDNKNNENYADCIDRELKQVNNYIISNINC